MLSVLAFMCFVFSSNGALPSFMHQCKPGDSACLLSSAKAAVPAFVQGVPELGLKTLDPLNIPLITSDQRGLKLQFHKSTLTGLKGCSIESIKSNPFGVPIHELEAWWTRGLNQLTALDFRKSLQQHLPGHRRKNEPIKNKQSITLKCNFVLSGNYNMNGQILVLPVEGKGKYKLDIRDIVVKVHAETENVTSSTGDTHWHINKWHQTFKVLTGVKFDLENLFNGNKVLGDPVLDFMNENWKDIMQEVAPPVVQALIAKVVEGVEDFYAAVSIEEMFAQ